MKHRKPSALENATLQRGHRPLAFQARLRARESKPAGSHTDNSAAAPATSEQSPQARQRAILARVKERAQTMQSSTPGLDRGTFLIGGSPVAPPATARADSEPTRAPEASAGSGAVEREPRKHARRRLYSKACPLCGRSVGLTHRTRLDRLVAKLVPVHRWRCGACDWSGLRIDRHEMKHLKRRVGRLIIIILAFLLGFAVMWYLDFLKYAYRPPE